MVAFGVWGENCQWQFARKHSDGNWVANREFLGSPLVLFWVWGISKNRADLVNNSCLCDSPYGECLSPISLLSARVTQQTMNY